VLRQVERVVMCRDHIGRAAGHDREQRVLQGKDRPVRAAKGVEFDTTVPNWRFTVQGSEVSHQLAEWFRGPACFLKLHRRPLADGELVECSLSREERGALRACHQAHVLEVAERPIAADAVFCGGRWPASLLAEMAKVRRALG
ncbi:MAG: hypothetical protein ACREX8_04875, partial [Gammaproteobacteria bacterium]